MGPLGVQELLLIFVVALLLFGPRKLPELGRSLGHAIGEFRRATNDLKHTIEEEVRADEIRRDLDPEKETAPPPAGTESR